MNCPNCGSSVNQEGAFCVVCGTKLINPNVQNSNYINSGVQPNNGFMNPGVQSNNGFVNPSVQPNNGFVNPTGNVKGAFNKYSIISVVFSAVSLFIFWWLAIAGISLGVQSLRQIKEKNEKGKALSIIGIIIGSVSISLFVIGIILNIIAL